MSKTNSKYTEAMQQYWSTHLTYIFVLLFIWAFVSFGLSILFVDSINSIRLGGFKLGFWFAQQGSIFVFIILIFLYTYLMHKLEEKFNVDHESKDVANH